jgi:hypothetical protein
MTLPRHTLVHGSSLQALPLDDQNRLPRLPYGLLRYRSKEHFLKVGLPVGADDNRGDPFRLLNPQYFPQRNTLLYPWRGTTVQKLLCNYRELSCLLLAEAPLHQRRIVARRNARSARAPPFTVLWIRG